MTAEQHTSEVKKTKFQSPVPFIIQFRRFIFGKQKPDLYTQLAFFANLIIWATFFVWHIISYFALQSKNVFLREKGIPVHRIIEQRGNELGFEPGVFADKIETYNAISAILWGVFFIGLILMYRKRKMFIHFTLSPIALYLLLSVFYLSFTYFMQDTTGYDKVAILIVIVSCLFHNFLLRNENSGGSISFFGEADQEEED